MAEEPAGVAPAAVVGHTVPAPEPPLASPRYRRSKPLPAFILMVAPFLLLVGVVVLPFIGWVVLQILLPIEFGRVGGRRLARGDAVWVAVPAGLLVGTYEIALIFYVLSLVPGLTPALDAGGLVVIALIYCSNTFFFSFGALSTSFDPNEAVEEGAGGAPSG